jgi:voltage-gated potassium channel
MDAAKLKKLGALGALLAVASPDDVSYEKLKARVIGAAARDPMDSVLSLTMVATYLFYKAEKGVNPKVETLSDALVFISTCLSVGYSDIFARTTTGKLVAAVVMTYGPALTASILRPPQPTPPVDDEMLATQRAIASSLEAILGELRAARA